MKLVPTTVPQPQVHSNIGNTDGDVTRVSIFNNKFFKVQLEDGTFFRYPEKFTVYSFMGGAYEYSLNSNGLPQDVIIGCRPEPYGVDQFKARHYLTCGGSITHFTQPGLVTPLQFTALYQLGIKTNKDKALIDTNWINLGKNSPMMVFYLAKTKEEAKDKLLYSLATCSDPKTSGVLHYLANGDLTPLGHCQFAQTKIPGLITPRMWNYKSTYTYNFIQDPTWFYPLLEVLYSTLCGVEFEFIDQHRDPSVVPHF